MQNKQSANSLKDSAPTNSEQQASTTSNSQDVIGDVWQCMRKEAIKEADAEPLLAEHLHATIIDHPDFASALSFHLAYLLGSQTLDSTVLKTLTTQAYVDNPELVLAAAHDMAAIRDRDSACHECGTPFLYYKGFHALQTYRIANYLWTHDRQELACYLQSITSTRFGVDIHPAATIGIGIMLDHATGIVVGETSTVGDNVSIMQAVTLGGTGKSSGDRHPKIGSGVLIGAGSKVLGNIRVGDSAQICAGSVVLNEVESHTVVAGVPAEVVGKIEDPMPALTMNQAPDSIS